MEDEIMITFWVGFIFGGLVMFILLKLFGV